MTKAGDVSIGARIRRARLREGFSQDELGKRIGSDQPHISQWELNRLAIPDSKLPELEKVLGKLRDDNTGSAESISPFGIWLRDARTKQGLSVPELADKSGLTAPAIYAIESGKSLNPQQVTRRRIEKALKTRVPVDVSDDAVESQSIEGLGSLTDFDPHDRDNLPTESGVYVFYDISERPVYVGKAEVIADRVKSHREKKWFIRPIVETAAYVLVKSREQRHQIEQLLIKFMKSNAIINVQSVVRDD